MAKMFYTLEEVCTKLEKDEDEVREMVQSGQIQEFRDRDKLMFKVEQIDLIVGGDEDTSDVHLELENAASGTDVPMPDDSSLGLADSREATGLIDASGSASSSGLGLADSRESISLSDSREGTGVAPGCCSCWAALVLRRWSLWAWVRFRQRARTCSFAFCRSATSRLFCWARVSFSTARPIASLRLSKSTGLTKN